MWQSIRVKSVFDAVDRWLTIPEVGEILNLSPGKVHRLIEDHALFTIKRDGVKLVPAHLISEGEPLPSIPGTLNVLADAGFSEESAIEWLYTQEESLGCRPIDSLVAGRKSEVRRIAQSLAI